MLADSAFNAEGKNLTDVVGIGLLTRVFHRDLVDQVLGETNRREERRRRLPARVVVYLVLALALYCAEPYEEVLRRLTNGLRGLKGWRDDWRVPTDSAVSQARKRLGPEPLAALFDRAAVPVARPGATGAFYRGRRLVAVDGVVLDVPDTAANLAEFGKSGKGKSRSAFPQVRVVTMTEVGSHCTIGCAFGPVASGERELTEQILDVLEPRMLLLCDRGFYSYDMWVRAAETGADLLWRLADPLELPVLQWLDDGSYRSRLLPRTAKAAIARGVDADRFTDQAIAVRVIEYMITGRGPTRTIRLPTTIADHTVAPAAELAALYAQRWEHELVFDEIETHQLHPSKVLRSRTVDGVKQEIWAILLVHYATRAFIAEAAEDLGEDPDRESFLRAIRIMRRQVENQAAFPPLTTKRSTP